MYSHLAQQRRKLTPTSILLHLLHMRKLLPVQSFSLKPLRNYINLLGLSSYFGVKFETLRKQASEFKIGNTNIHLQNYWMNYLGKGNMKKPVMSLMTLPLKMKMGWSFSYEQFWLPVLCCGNDAALLPEDAPQMNLVNHIVYTPNEE